MKVYINRFFFFFNQLDGSNKSEVEVFLDNLKKEANEKLNEYHKTKNFVYLTTENFSVTNPQIIDAYKARILKEPDYNQYSNLKDMKIKLLFLNTIRLKSKSVPRSLDLCYLYYTPQYNKQIFYRYDEDILNLDQGSILNSDKEKLSEFKDYFKDDSPYAEQLSSLFLDFSR